MNKDRIQGFTAGVLTAVLALGLGGAALAVSRTIQVEDSITVTINGARFSPRDVNGKEVPLFAYEGTTYAPIRALCEAAGLEVNYDTATGTAILTTQDMALAADPNADSYITSARAKEIALTHAGVSTGDAVFLTTKLDWDKGRTLYEVEFYCGNVEYDYDVDALTGEVVSFGHELECYDIHYAGGNAHQGDHGQHHGAWQSPPADRISESRALEIAAGRLGTTVYTVEKCELDCDDGVWVYEIELRAGYSEYECDVHAVTGAILKWEADHD